jgi:RNA polymerase primary sigma factor
MAQVRLSAMQERDLVVAAECGDAEVCSKLVEAFPPAIDDLALSFQSRVVGRLVQEGVVGLLFAARRYDLRVGAPFRAYASFWVRKATQELVADLIRPVALV